MAKAPGLNTWVNRTTRQFLSQISSGGMESRFPSEIFHNVLGPISNANWIHAPDLSSVADVPNRYWIITGTNITEMSASEKAVVDTAALSSFRDSLVSEIDESEGTLRQIVKMLVDELNILRALHGLPNRTLEQVRNKLRNGYGS